MHPIPPYTSTSPPFLYPLPKYSISPNTSTPLPISNLLPNTLRKTNSTPKPLTSLNFSTSHPTFTNPLNTSEPNFFVHPSQTPQNFTRIDIHSFFKSPPKQPTIASSTIFFKSLRKHLTSVYY